jgi:RimJ/RimL family protein N-acetyltransferase
MSSRIFLRPLKVEDALVSYKWRNNPRIWKYTKNRPDKEITPEIEMNWIKNVINDNTRANFAICLVSDNSYIGNIYAVNIKDNKAELGVFIGEESCHGCGYGVEALSLLKQILNKDYGISELLINVNLKNTPAVRTYLSNGATFNEDVMTTMSLKTDC